MNDQSKNINRSANACITAAELIAYQQGDLSAEEMYKVEMHALDCPLCADALEGFAEPGAEKALADLDEMFAKTILNKKNIKKNTGFIYRKQVLAIAAILFVILGGTYLFNLVTDTSRSRMMSENASPTESTETKEDPVHTEKILENKDEKSDGSALDKTSESPVIIVEDKPRPAQKISILDDHATIHESEIERPESDVIKINSESKKELASKQIENNTTGFQSNAPVSQSDLKKKSPQESKQLDSEMYDSGVSLSEVTVTQSKPVTRSVTTVDGVSKDKSVSIQNKNWNVIINEGNAIAINTTGNNRVNIYSNNNFIKREHLSLVGNVISYMETVFDKTNSSILSRQIVAKDLNHKGNPASLILLFKAEDIYAAFRNDKKLLSYVNDNSHSNLTTFLNSFNSDCKVNFNAILSSYSIVKTTSDMALVRFGLPGNCENKLNQYTEFKIWISLDKSRISTFEEAAGKNNFER